MKIPLLHTLFTWYGKRTVLIITSLVLLLAIIGFSLTKSTEPEAAETNAVLPTVKVATAGQLSGDSSIRLIGVVEAISEAEVESETSGRIISVGATLGQSVNTGHILVQLENATQRAAVLQAEGSYEAALAAAASSDVSTNESENNLRGAQDSAIASYRSAYNAANDMVRTIADQLYSRPNEGAVPGLRINGDGNTNLLNSERLAYRTLLSDWEKKSLSLSFEDDLPSALIEADGYLDRMLVFNNAFIAALSVNTNTSIFSASEISSFLTNFANSRSTITTIQANLDTNRTNLLNANRALERAEIAGSNSTVSSASAQVKQALGALRNAQANLAKTIIRAPITGQVNAIDVQVGDFLNSGSIVATIANNDALEVTTFIGENDAGRIALGDAVTIDTDIEGVIAAIAPAVDSSTGKVEVEIAATDDRLQNGDTVTVSIASTKTASTSPTGPLLVPLSAVKFTADSGAVFIVIEGILERIPVSIGEVFGTQIAITEGIEASDEIVIDARGLSAGEAVSAVR